MRCSGNLPCDTCVREEVQCLYANGQTPNSTSPAKVQESHAITTSVYQRSIPDATSQLRHDRDGTSDPSNVSRTAQLSRRSSLEPPQSFSQSHHVGENAGVSFLYFSQGQQQDRTTPLVNEAGSGAPLIAFGDIPLIDSETLSSLPQPLFTSEQIHKLLEKYFNYISPTYCFLHLSTVRRWADSYVSSSPLTNAQQAVVLLVCAQTLLHNTMSPEQARPGHGDTKLSQACFERAKTLIEREPGPPSISSVQARIGMCLYLLSAFRLNEARYCFSFATTIATALGIHRKQSSSARGLSLIESECRKRAFWALYVLDGYLSVILGRPRILRDEDIDQPLPENLADHDLTAESESLDHLPRHGNLVSLLYSLYTFF